MAASLCNVIFEAKEMGEISEETRCLREEREKKSMHFLLKCNPDETDSEYVCVKIRAYGPDLEGEHLKVKIRIVLK